MSTDDALVDSDSTDNDHDRPAAATEKMEEQEEDEEEISPSELPPIPTIFADFVSAAAWAAMSAATRALLVSGVPTLIKSIHREKEKKELTRKGARVDDEESLATVGACTATGAAVRVEEPEASSAVLHWDGISSKQAAADKEALISSSARFSSEQKRVASLQAGRQDSVGPGAVKKGVFPRTAVLEAEREPPLLAGHQESSGPSRVTPTTYAAIGPPLGSHSAPPSGLAAVKKVVISRAPILGAEQERVASLLAGHQHSLPPPRVTSGTYATILPPLGPHSAPAYSAPAPQKCAYNYHPEEGDFAFIGILLTVIASYRQVAFRKYDAQAVMEAASILVSELTDCPGATLAYALGHAAATFSTSSLRTSAHELLLALRAGYRNACRPISWSQLPPPTVTAADAKACAVPRVAQRSALGGGKSDRRNSARTPTSTHGPPRRGVDRRRKGNAKDPSARGAKKVDLYGRRLGKEKEKVFGLAKGRGNFKNTRSRAAPHPPPPAALFSPPAAAALPSFGGARLGLQPGL